MEVVADQHPEGRALHGLGHDDEGPRCPHDLVQEGHQLTGGRDLLAGEQDVGIVADRLHPGFVGHHVGRHEAVGELVALGELDLHPAGRRFLHGDDALQADRVESLGDHLADVAVVVRGDGRHMGHLGTPCDGVAHAVEAGEDPAHRALHPPFEKNGVGALVDGLHAGADHGLGQHGRGGRPVAGDVVGLGGHLLDELCPHVLERVPEVDLPGDGHTVVGDRRRARELLQHDVAPLGAERHLDAVGQLVDARLQPATSFLVESELFGHEISPL